jgi:predicted Holliday junction resolvase-like endonuclease
MKRKAVILVVALLLVAGLAQVGFAALDNNSGTFREKCAEIWANLSPEQQEQVEAAREEHREQMQALREEFQARRAALREEFLQKLPEEVRAQVEERMAAREERMAERRGMRGPGNGWHGDCPQGEN